MPLKYWLKMYIMSGMHRLKCGNLWLAFCTRYFMAWNDVRIMVLLRRRHICDANCQIANVLISNPCTLYKGNVLIISDFCLSRCAFSCISNTCLIICCITVNTKRKHDSHFCNHIIIAKGPFGDDLFCGINNVVYVYFKWKQKPMNSFNI